MTTRPWLIDKSALVRLGECRDSAEWAERIERGLVRITTVTLLEVGYSARSADDMGDQFDLPPAIAERAQLTVLHLDKDFELIAEITRQAVERLE
jgi:predicted nucleic acid-binding protein